MKTKNMKMKIVELTTLGMIAGLAMLPNAFAQADRGGNGGDPNEIAEFIGRNGERLASWYEVKQDLIRGFEMNRQESLNLGSIDKKMMQVNVLDALKTVRVEFTLQKIEINGVQRPCRNYIENSVKHIECNTALYSATMQNYTSEEQYKFIAHEYFGVTGIEPNTYGISDYAISSQISKSLSEVKVKKWAVLPQAEKIYGIQCEIEQQESYLNKYRRIILQAHEKGARLLVSEGITKTKEKLLEVYDKVRGYGVFQGVQVFYDLKSAASDGSFASFGGQNNEYVTGKFKLEINAAETIAFEVSARKYSQRTGDMEFFLRKANQVLGYNTSGVCRVVEFDDFNFFTPEISYGESWLNDQESVSLLNKTAHWLQRSNSYNEYLSKPGRSPI